MEKAYKIISDMLKEIEDMTGEMLDSDFEKTIPPITISFNGKSVEIPLDFAEFNNAVMYSLTEIKEAFEYLQITKETDTTTSEPVYYLWYPTDEDAFKAAGSVEAYDGTWWKSTIRQVQEDDANNNGNKDGEINDTLFSREAKLDELYNIGNLMTTYLVDEGLLPLSLRAKEELCA